ncbi:MAG: peptide MFS transporter, partial [Archangium sp.]
MAQSTAAAPTRGHPKGLYLLFTTEMWERMSYYGMRALLVLYMVSAANKGGFGWTQAKALEIYGIYT